MSLQGPIVAVGRSADLIEALGAAGAFPVIEASCADAAAAIAAAAPAAIVLADPDAAADAALADILARDITRRAPIVPVIARADTNPAYREALVTAADAAPGIVVATISSALRVRNLHAAVLRRAEAARAAGRPLPQTPAHDPIEDATVVLAGRGRSYPALSVGLGEQTGVIGVLTIEAAARYLRSRDADGLVIGDGFNPRNVEAMLTVIAEDSRFRDLPVGVLGRGGAIEGLPHLLFAGSTESVIARILPLVRLHAFEARLRRTLDAFDKNGIIDPATGLMCRQAFVAELERVLLGARAGSAGLSLARLSFDERFDARALNDAARIVGKLMRGADFACRDDDGSILVAFAETELKHAHVVARRLASVLKHTMLQPDQRAPCAPSVILAGRKSSDTAASLLARVTMPAVAAE